MSILATQLAIRTHTDIWNQGASAEQDLSASHNNSQLDIPDDCVVVSPLFILQALMNFA